MDTDTALVTQLTTLARLDTSPAQQAVLATQLPHLLHYVGQLRTVEADQVPAPRQAPARLRDDVASPSQTVDAILAQAPAKQDRWWVVAKVLP